MAAESPAHVVLSALQDGPQASGPEHQRLHFQAACLLELPSPARVSVVHSAPQWVLHPDRSVRHSAPVTVPIRAAAQPPNPD